MTNIGHLDTAAGVVSLIKVILSMQNQQLPASLHYESPNPEMNIKETPFSVNTKLMDWNPSNKRIAGISSFGIGGTNAHMIVEEADNHTISTDVQIPIVLPVSAKSIESLQAIQHSLCNFIQKNPKVSLTDILFTLLNFRKEYKHRGSIIIENGKFFCTNSITEKPETTVFLFSGQGTQYAGMAKFLYDNFDSAKNEIDDCLKILNNLVNWDAGELLLNDSYEIDKTEYTQPLLFILEYSMARFLIDIGIAPDYLSGHFYGHIQ